MLKLQALKFIGTAKELRWKLELYAKQLKNYPALTLDQLLNPTTAKH